MEIRQGPVDLYMCHILTPYYLEVVWSHNVAMWLKDILIIKVLIWVFAGCLSDKDIA